MAVLEVRVAAADFENLVHMLQISITPVALISGIGLLLLAMSNRYARTTDGARTLARQVKDMPVEQRENVLAQVRILFLRSRILRLSIVFALFSIFCVSLLIFVLFITYYARLNLTDVIVGLFTVSFLSLVISLAFFIRDLTMSLNALRQELKDIV
jgi:hypothetical protein